MARNVASVGDSRGTYKLLLRGRKRKRQFERHRRRWKDNIKIYLREVGVWLAGILGLNPARGTEVFLLWVLCVVR
jgi:hypothetical protein